MQITGGAFPKMTVGKVILELDILIDYDVEAVTAHTPHDPLFLS
jgi:hypothetical protein